MIQYNFQEFNSKNSFKLKTTGFGKLTIKVEWVVWLKPFTLSLSKGGVASSNREVWDLCFHV
jgi:hypothetical protein